MTRLMVVLSAAVLALFALSLTLGPASVSAGESLAALFSVDYGPLTLVMQEIYKVCQLLNGKIKM